MSINQQYQPMYQQARQLQYRFHDMLGSTDPNARILHREVESLVTDMETNRNPRDIENRIKTIQNHMHQVEHQSQPLMSYSHAEAMHHDFESMRRNVRSFHNYS